MKVSLLIISFLFSVAVFGQDGELTTEVKDKANDLLQAKKAIDDFIAAQKSNVFRFGFSVAYRKFLDNSEGDKRARAIPTITPNTKVVSLDYGDKLSVVISTTIAAYPFIKSSDSIDPDEDDGNGFIKILRNFGFLANINLTEFADSKTSNIFNKQVDGGLGFSYMLGRKQKFAVALTFERISIRQPTEFIFQSVGKQIMDDNGNPLTALDIKDERYFYNAGANGWSFKFVFHFD